MSEKKIIAVIGATGAQGGGLVQAILNDPKGPFKVRAITRKANSEKAKKLKKQGVEVVKADLDNLQSLKKAFRGAYGAYCVTNFWEHFSPEKELAQAKNLAKATNETGLKHVIWSTFEDTRKYVPLHNNSMPTLMGKYKVPHFDGKAEANKFFTDLGVPTTFLLTSFYWENFIYFGMEPKPGPDDVLAITFPMGNKKLPGIAARDIGHCAYGIFKKDKTYIGKTVGISGEQLTGREMAAALSMVIGQRVVYNEVSPEQFRSFGFPGAEDLGNMFQFKRDFNDMYCSTRNPEVTRALHPGLETFNQWLDRNRELIPVQKMLVPS